MRLVCVCLYECVCSVRKPIKACDQVQVSAGCRRQTRRRSARVSTSHRMDGLFGDSVCSLSKTVGTAFISIHHLRRDDWAFREAGRPVNEDLKGFGCTQTF